MIDKKQKHKLKKFIKDLEGIRGRHTELVSVFIPAGYDLNKIIQHLGQEQGTASNIKDARTRKNVIDSLERMIRHLRLYERTPPHGLAVYAGNCSSSESKIDIQVFSIEPPSPLNMRLYRCDQYFHVEELRGMVATKETYGLIVLDNREATVGFVRGTAMTVLKQMHSAVPGKIKSGGQSQQRFARLREIAAHDFYERIASVVNKEFLAMGQNLKGILIGGPGMTKETFAHGNHLNNQLKEKIKTIQDLSYTDEFGLKELLEKSRDVLSEDEIVQERNAVHEFLKMLAKEPSKVAYGRKDVEKALAYSAVKKLLVSENVKDIDAFDDLADSTGAELMIISLETSEGVQLRDLGGFAAILRFPIGE